MKDVMKDVMIDLETFGNGPNKCICQIGAVYFDRVTGEMGAEFKANIDAASHVATGAQIDAATVYWWLAQSDAARASVLAEPKEDVRVVMQRFAEFLAPATRIWSHATFDFVTIMDTFRQLNIRHTVSYRAGLDLRTLTYLSGVSVKGFPREGTHHDGLDDAKHQVKYAVAALNAVKANKQALKFLLNLEGKTL